MAPIRRPRKAVEGLRIGIVTLSTSHDLVCGNVQHADSFPFHVAYAAVRDVAFDHIACGDPRALKPIIEAARRLEETGVDIVVGACGSFVHYQREVAGAIDVPVCLSILMQIPFILSMLPPTRKLGVVFARSSTFTALAQDQCGVTAAMRDRLVFLSAADTDSFAPMLDPEQALDDGRLRQDLVAMTRQVAAADPAIGAWLLQCSDLPPYAPDIGASTGLPVWDMVLLVEHLRGAVARRAFASTGTAT